MREKLIAESMSRLERAERLFAEMKEDRSNRSRGRKAFRCWSERAAAQAFWGKIIDIDCPEYQEFHARLQSMPEGEILPNIPKRWGY
jgi:hypothetical protein